MATCLPMVCKHRNSFHCHRPLLTERARDRPGWTINQSIGFYCETTMMNHVMVIIHGWTAWRIQEKPTTSPRSQEGREREQASSFPVNGGSLRRARDLSEVRLGPHHHEGIQTMSVKCVAEHVQTTQKH